MGFYKLDANSKHSFINQTSVMSTVKNSSIASRKKKSYSYYLLDGEISHRVCKSYYLATLAVSQKMVYNVHEKKDPVSGVIKVDGRGKHSNHFKVDEVQRKFVIDHINSFPVIESHYCRAKTNKKYLEPGLNIEKMYDLYKSQCIDQGHSAVKSSYYRYVFNNFFNIGFHVPKTDRCDRCEEYKIKKQENITLTEKEIQSHDAHLNEKIQMRSEKERDKSDKKKSTIMIVFDLENVITLPKADVGSFFL